MKEYVKKLLFLMDEKEKRRFFLLLVLLSIMGITEAVGVASIIPFLTVLADPSQIWSQPILAKAYGIVGAESEMAFLVILGLFVLGVVLFSLAYRLLVVYLTIRFAHLQNHSLSSRLIAQYLGQPYEWFLNKNSADLARTVLQEVNRLVGTSLIPALRMGMNAVSVVFITALLVFVDPVASLIAAGIIGGSYLMLFLVSRRYLTIIGKENIAANKRRFSLAQIAFGALKEIKIGGFEQHYTENYTAASLAFARTTAAGQLVSELPRNLLEIFAFGTLLGTVLYLVVAADGEIVDVLPVIGVFAFAGLRIFPAAQLTFHSLAQIRFSGAVLDAVLEEFRETADARMPVADSRRLAAPTSAIELRDISFSYGDGPGNTLDGLNVSISARTTVGIVGGTGAGKTTAVDILMGLLEPSAGGVYVENTLITEENRRQWQRCIGYVPQQIFLIDDSVAANIALGIPEDRRDIRRIKHAARLASLDEFVERDLPDGYATRVGENGVRLSGGQRQRIGIARALYADPDVIVFDEATSALDNITERAVMEAVKKLGRDKTIIMIAHRLSTVRDCDKIMYLENGRLKDEGSYDWLIENSESFRRLAAGGDK